MSWKSRALSPRSILPALAVLLVLVAGAAAHANKPVPFGDRVAAPGASDASPDAVKSLDAADLDLRVGPGLEAYHKATGEHAWSYQREGATALYLSMAGENAVVVWDDGLVTSVRPGDHEVRWHRAVPGLADWLRADGEPGADKRTEEQRKQLATERAAASLRTVQQSAPWVAVVTPNLTMGFRDADGDLRYNSKPAGNCVYDPTRTVASDFAVLVPRSCSNSSGQSVSGGISGYRLDSSGWQLNAGPGVSMKALDGRRVLISDGPIVAPKVFDTRAAAPEAACGSPAEPFAAVRPEGSCAAPADGQQPR
ncbi:MULTISPECIES: hypothetical protein [unclassified Streptomyces]|uniref:hypothetical protein n=1 Tax=Streptomycetaceae TaxID=2062 RepID=UPI002E77FD8F|nr:MULTISPECIES: hypothetical protein [unclassified Streptomyces]MED7950512.1 hypothetical protein [Streptomyces sp. BE303]MEE1827239.1 hypothetical protein [Streptomyces sp. BE20]